MDIIMERSDPEQDRHKNVLSPQHWYIYSNAPFMILSHIWISKRSFMKNSLDFSYLLFETSFPPFPRLLIGRRCHPLHPRPPIGPPCCSRHLIGRRHRQPLHSWPPMRWQWFGGLYLAAQLWLSPLEVERGLRDKAVTAISKTAEIKIKCVLKWAKTFTTTAGIKTKFVWVRAKTKQ